MKKLFPLLLLTTLVLTSCTPGSLFDNKGISSGILCKSPDAFAENKGIEYTCWQSGDGTLVWRQNREVIAEYNLRNEEIAARDRTYYDCLALNARGIEEPCFRPRHDLNY